MSPGLTLVFWGFVLFEAKHFVCDFVLQTAYQYRNKGTYGHPGGLLHAGLHAAGSLPAVLISAQNGGFVAAILAAEFVIHYHVDWLKEQVNKRYGLTTRDAPFWMVFGADQLTHQMTYLAMLVVLARAANL
jgi:Protein of unknown function (DUF3307)